jgi:hypothetical protein
MTLLERGNEVGAGVRRSGGREIHLLPLNFTEGHGSKFGYDDPRARMKPANVGCQVGKIF